MFDNPAVCRVTRCPLGAVTDPHSRGKWWADVPALSLDHFMGERPEHFPVVRARLAWDEDALRARFHVRDRYVRAVAREHQDPVCRDSCVEFFFTPGEHLGMAYFNLEVNCGGTMLFTWHPESDDPVPVADEDCDRLEVVHSLPKVVEPEIKEPTDWTLEYRLPLEVVTRYCPQATWPAPGVVWQANVYKCADDTSHPHWLTWARVDHPTPRFHLPQYFGTLRFE